MTSAPVTLAPQLADFDAQYAAIAARADALVSGLTAAQCNWRPAPGRWSIAECLRHLIAADSLYLVKMDQMIAEARAKGLTGPGPYRFGWFGAWFARSLEPPPRFKVKTQRVFDIARGRDWPVEETLADFGALVAGLRDRLRRANGVELGRVKTTSPAARLLSFSLGACFAILAAHERRHLWQAEQVRTALQGLP